jgi:hypothetical protein
MNGFTFLRGAILAALAIGLAACQTAGEGGGVSGAGVPVAVETLEGAPEGMSARVQQAVTAQASARSIEVVPPESDPRFRLRGYLTAYANEDGTALTFVWDVFDSSRKRAQRVTTTTQTSRRAGEEPWAAISDADISKAAGRSRDGVAAFLAAARSHGAENAQ